MKELEPGTALTVRTALAIKKPAVLVHLGLTVPVGEVVVLLLKDSKLAPVLLLTVMLSLDVYLTPPVAVLVQVGLTVPAGEAVVLLPKDSKLAPVLLLTVIVSLDACLTPHALPPTPSLYPKPAQVQEP